MTYLVDSDWIIDALRGISSVEATLDRLYAEGLAVSTITVAEVLEGTFGHPDAAERTERFRLLLVGYRILPVTWSVAEVFAERRRELRRLGTPIADLDLLIAATAITHDLILATNNRRHFERVRHLKLLA